MSSIGGGLHDDPEPDRFQGPVPSRFRSRVREIGFFALLGFGVIAASRTLPLPVFLLMTYLGTLGLGMAIGWRGRDEEAIRRRGL